MKQIAITVLVAAACSIASAAVVWHVAEERLGTLERSLDNERTLREMGELRPDVTSTLSAEARRLDARVSAVEDRLSKLVR